MEIRLQLDEGFVHSDLPADDEEDWFPEDDERVTKMSKRLRHKKH